jgi:hypothetical protein
MDSHQIDRAAIPTASDELCSHVLWGRTCFPFGAVTPRDLYRAADRYRRAAEHGKQLCDMCDRLEVHGTWMCAQCRSALTPNASFSRHQQAGTE